MSINQNIAINEFFEQNRAIHTMIMNTKNSSEISNMVNIIIMFIMLVIDVCPRDLISAYDDASTRPSKLVPSPNNQKYETESGVFTKMTQNQQI